MAKSKAKKASQGGGSVHLRARLEYLHKAAVYFSTTPGQPNTNHEITTTHASDQGLPMPNTTRRESKDTNENKKTTTASLPRHYISHMRGVSLKSQLRLPTDVKRSFCKRCDLPLVPGVNCVRETKNTSKGHKKPWADVFVVRCLACETEKRFPQTPKRSKKLAERRKEVNAGQEGNKGKALEC